MGEKFDVTHLGKRAGTSLREIKRVMDLIDKRVAEKGSTVNSQMTPIEANSCVAEGMSILGWGYD